MSQSSHLLQRLLPIAVLALAIVSVPTMLLSRTGVPRLRALNEEKVRVNTEVSRLSEQIRQLRSEVDRVKSDPSKVEQVARDQLGLLRQTELVFQFGP